MQLRFIIILFIVLISTGRADEPNIDSLSNLLIKTVQEGKYDDKDTKMQYSIIADYYRRTNPLEALNFHYKMIRIAEENSNDNFRAANYVSIGTIYQDQGVNGRALENYYTAMKYIDESLHGDYCWLYIFIGNVYYSEELYDEAIEFYIKADSGFDSLGHNSEKISDPKDRDNYWSYAGKAVAVNNIGLCYRNIEQYDSAMYYFQKGLEYRKQQGHIFGLGHSGIYIGEIYYKKGQYDSALITYSHALELLDSALYVDKGSKLEIQVNYTRCLYNIGLVFEEEGNIDKAESLIKASLDSLITLGDKNNIAYRYLNLAEFYNRHKKYQEAIYLAQSALELSIKYDLYNPALESSFFLLGIFKKLDRFDKSCIYQAKYDSIKDKVYKKFNEFSIQEVSTRMDNEKKLVALEKDKAIKEYSIQQQKTIIIILAVFGLVVLIGIVLFWNKLKIIEKLNNTLAEKNLLLSETNKKLSESETNLAKANDELKTKNQDLVASENNLKELNATKDKFFSIIAHDLKNPFGSFKSILELLDREYDKIGENDRRELVAEMHVSSQHLFELLENLLTWSRTQRSKIDYNPEYGDFKQIIDSNIAFLGMNAGKKSIKLISEAEGDLFATFDANMMLTVVRNLISNAIKFTPNEGTITIGASKQDEFLKAYVKDTGVGMPPDVINKLFRIDVNVTTPGTNQERGTGLGLILCKEFIDMHSGTIRVESKPGKGSTFIIEFPVEEQHNS